MNAEDTESTNVLLPAVHANGGCPAVPPTSAAFMNRFTTNAAFSNSGGGGGGCNTTTSMTPTISQLSPISPSVTQLGQVYTSDVSQYGPIYNSYNYANSKSRTSNSSPYARAPATYPATTYHQNPFPNAAFYARSVQNPYDYTPR